jgi:hypothetical protein
MSEGPKTNCRPDAERLAHLAECMEPGGPDDEPADWPGHSHSCISAHCVAYSCGRLALEGKRLKHLHDREELRLCRWVARRATHYLEGVEVYFSEASSDYLPFYLTTNLDENLADDLSERALRRAFGGVIYPKAAIRVFPLEGDGWQGRVGAEEHPGPWERLRRFFRSVPDLVGAAYVEIGDHPLSDTNFGCAFPRLVLAVTEAGSLAGVCGHAVHT